MHLGCFLFSLILILLFVFILSLLFMYSFPTFFTYLYGVSCWVCLILSQFSIFKIMECFLCAVFVFVIGVFGGNIYDLNVVTDSESVVDSNYSFNIWCVYFSSADIFFYLYLMGFLFHWCKLVFSEVLFLSCCYLF